MVVVLVDGVVVAVVGAEVVCVFDAAVEIGIGARETDGLPVVTAGARVVIDLIVDAVLGADVTEKSHPQKVVVPWHFHDWGEQKLEGPPTMRQSESPKAPGQPA